MAKSLAQMFELAETGIDPEDDGSNEPLLPEKKAEVDDATDDDEGDDDDEETPLAAAPVDKTGEETDDEEDAGADDDDEDAEDEVEADDDPPAVADTPTRNLMKWFEENYGLDLGKYASDADGLHGIANAMKLVGKRDEDAAWAAKLKPHKDKIDALLSGDAPATPAAPAPPAEPEYSEVWEVLIKAGQAPPEIIEKYNTRVTWERKRLQEILKDPGSLVNGQIEKLLKERLEPIEQDTKARREQDAVNARNASMNSWIAWNAGSIFVDGKVGGELTALGKKASEIYQKDPTLQRLAQQMPAGSEVELSDMALRLARTHTPAPKKTRKVSKQAVRKPNLATAPADKGVVTTALDAIKSGKGLAAAMAMLETEDD